MCQAEGQGRGEEADRCIRQGRGRESLTEILPSAQAVCLRSVAQPTCRCKGSAVLPIECLHSPVPRNTLCG